MKLKVCMKLQAIDKKNLKRGLSLFKSIDKAKYMTS